MTNEIELNNTLFESIKHFDEDGKEFWYARELQKVLEYKEWRTFNEVLKKAKAACYLSINSTINDFVEVDKIVKAGATSKKINDYKLSRYACYLIAQNGDSRKKSNSTCSNILCSSN